MFGTSCPPSARDGKPALGAHFGLTTRFLSTPKTALLACGTNAVGLYERAGIAISARRYAFSAEIVVLSWEVPSENTCSRRIFYSELTVLATISIQNTVVRAPRLVSNISLPLLLQEIVVLSLGVPSEITCSRRIFLIRAHGSGNHFCSKTNDSCTALLGNHGFRASATCIFCSNTNVLATISIQKTMVRAHDLH